MPTQKLHRKGAVYLADPLANAEALDRNARARLIALAEAYEHRTKAKGRKIGALGHVGLEVLRSMLFHFAGGKGRCWPSYKALANRTGRSIDAIAGALKRLEAAGFLKIIRRKRALRVGPATFVVQDTNVYSFPTVAAAARMWIAPIVRPVEKVRAWAQRVRESADSVFREVNQSKIFSHRKSPQRYGLIDIG